MVNKIIKLSLIITLIKNDQIKIGFPQNCPLANLKKIKIKIIFGGF